MKNLDRSLKSFPYNIINHTSDSKQGHTPENTFQLQRVTENSIGNVVSSQLASLKDLIKNNIKKNPQVWQHCLLHRSLLEQSCMLQTDYHWLIISDGNVRECIALKYRCHTAIASPVKICVIKIQTSLFIAMVYLFGHNFWDVVCPIFSPSLLFCTYKVTFEFIQHIKH